MKHDKLKQYVALRDALQNEKAQLETRLTAINEALGTGAGVSATIVGTAKRPGRRPNTAGAISKKVKPSKRGKAPGKFGSGKRKGKLGGNTISLRAAVAQVTTSKPLTKQEILAAVDKLGYTFTTKNPLNSLNQILYKCTNPKFKNVKGRFSAA
jgi:hypothetical protein